MTTVRRSVRVLGVPLFWLDKTVLPGSSAEIKMRRKSIELHVKSGGLEQQITRKIAPGIFAATTPYDEESWNPRKVTVGNFLYNVTYTVLPERK